MVVIEVLQEYKDSQKRVYEIVNNSLKNDKISHAYLIETNGVSYASDFALSLAKSFLCYSLDEDESKRICNLVDSGNYPDIVVVDSKKMIKKEEMLSLQEKFKNKPLYGKYMIYIINDASLLNASSGNTILKFLEEPSRDIVAILLVNNISLVLDTIVSRCMVLSLVNDVSLFDNICKKYDCDISLLNKAIEYYSKMEDERKLFFISDMMYSFSSNIELLLEVGFYLYSDLLHLCLNVDLVFFKDFSVILNSMLKNNDFYDIIRKIDVISKFIKDCSFNVNKDLFMDSFVIQMIGDVSDD